MKKIILLLFSITMIISCNKENSEDPGDTGASVSSPTNLNVSSTFTDKIVLSWAFEDGVQGYEIFRAVGNASDNPETLNFQLKGQSTANGYEDLGVTPDTSFFYKVRTIDGDSRSEFSGAVFGKTIIAFIPPENLQASTEFALKITLSWNSLDGVDGYNIYRANNNLTGGDPNTLNYVLIGSTSQNTFEDLSVNSNKYYFYRASSYRGSSESDFSSPKEGNTILLSANEAFEFLAEQTQGQKYDAFNASQVPNIIIDVIEEQTTSNTDIVFLIDNTGSMDDDINEIKNAINNIVSTLKPGNRLAMAVYNDANEDPSGWYEWFDLTSDFSQALIFLNSISVYGGGDIPESVYDGIYLTVDNLSWESSSKRMIIVIGDAPPLEGSLTTFDLVDCINICNDNSVVTNLYPILISD